MDMGILGINISRDYLKYCQGKYFQTMMKFSESFVIILFYHMDYTTLLHVVPYIFMVCLYVDATHLVMILFDSTN